MPFLQGSARRRRLPLPRQAASIANFVGCAKKQTVPTAMEESESEET
jgi:hypothetical protein